MIAVTIVSGAKPFRYAKPLRITASSVEKMPASTSPFKRISTNTRQPTTSPTPIPVNIDCFARFSLPAPMFCATKEAIDCISALGTSIAKLTILQATPYPEDASSPSRLINAQRAKNESWVRNSCSASGRPIARNLRHCGLKRKSFFPIVNGRSFFIRSTIANTTLTACANTVASAAPAASR